MNGRNNIAVGFMGPAGRPRPEDPVPELLCRGAEGKRRFSFVEMYRSFVCTPSAIICLAGNRRGKLVRPDLVKRIQLAVTGGDDCPACSHGHAKMALRHGMSDAEICGFLKWADDFIKPEEAKAILLARHFAGSRGYSRVQAFEALVKEHGERKVRVMLAAAQVTIAVNMYGAPYGAFRSRRKGRPFKGIPVFFGPWMLIGGALGMPVALLYAVLRGALDQANERMDRSATDQWTTRTTQS